MFPTPHPLSPVDYAAKSLANLRGVTFAHLNIRSLLNKKDDICLLLSESKLDCLCLTETHLKSFIDDSELLCAGYDLFRYDRTRASGKSSGGGIAIYTNSDRTFVEVLNSHICTPDIEAVWLKLSLERAHDTYICSVYRAPDGNVDRGIDTLCQQIENLGITFRDDIIFLGDFNVDLLTNSPSKNRIELFRKNNNLDQLIKSPTRVCERSSTLIDHVYVNNSDQYHHWGVLNPGLSDHSMIYTNRKKPKQSKEKDFRIIQCYRHFNPDDFVEDLELTDWSPVFAEVDIEPAVDIFNKLFLTCVDKHMPLKRHQSRIHSAPWVTTEYLSFRDRNTYYSTMYDGCPCYYHVLLKRDAQRMCQRSKNSLKREYIRTTLDRHKHNPKKIWRSIRNFWPSKKQDSKKIKLLNGKQDSAEIAAELNMHFCTTGSRIQQNIEDPSHMPMFNPVHRPPVFDLSYFSDDEVADAICRLSSSRASGPDQITSFMLKSGKSAITFVLTHLFNLSIRKKSFPNVWKYAKVTPLYKSGPRHHADNYRPISVLPTIGKVLERLVHGQCQKYLTEHNILSEAQAGFREGRSTGTCLAQFLHNIYEGIDRGSAVGVLFLDLAKAFDSVDHPTLLNKLRCLGFKASTVT